MSDEQLSGRALDKAVAEAFGVAPSFTWEVFNEDETATMIGFDREREAQEWFDQNPHAHKEHHVGKMAHYPLYSESIEAAMQVVERLALLRWQAHISRHLIAPYWQVELYAHEGDTWTRKMAESDSLPEAICLAALKALQEKKG